MIHSTDTVVMVSPDDFKFNVQAGETNSFQNDIQIENVAAEALKDFDRIHSELTSHGVKVVKMMSRKDVSTPDAVFPNNWFSVHVENGKTTLVLYPMLNPNRQAERQVAELIRAMKEQNISIDEVIDMTYFEEQNIALEGTGSLVLDRTNKIAYASISPRMNESILQVFCEKLGYTSVVFSSYNIENKLIYHTNVMMSVGTQFTVICLDAITNETERNAVVHSFASSGKKVIEITQSQLNNMCGNILEVKSAVDGRPKIAMSTTAYNAFTPEQRVELSTFGDIVHANISTIETIGGGSVRCMLAEIFHA